MKIILTTVRGKSIHFIFKNVNKIPCKSKNPDSQRETEICDGVTHVTATLQNAQKSKQNQSPD